MAPTVTDEYIVSIQIEFIQTLYCSFFLHCAVSGNLQSPGVACGCMSMCMNFCLVSILFFRVIIYCTLCNAAAAPGDQSMSNERPRDL